MSRRKREQMQAEAREAEERALREADSLERSGENEYLYNRIRRDSVADDATDNNVTPAVRVDSVAVQRSTGVKRDSLQHVSPTDMKQEE